MTIPKIGLFIYPNISSFHFSIPQIIFNIPIENEPLFHLKIFSLDGEPIRADQSVIIAPDGDLKIMEECDIVIIPGWDDIEHRPDPSLIQGLQNIHRQGIQIMSLCYGTYALAYSGILDGQKATTHWMASKDFALRFPNIQLNCDALYIDENNIITSAGIGASLDSCLYLIRKFYNAQIANKISRIMVISPHREGGQAQFIEQPIAKSGQNAQINILLDYLRKNLSIKHNIDDLSARVHMTRRTFTRNFKKATGMTLIEWLNNERIRYSCELLETTHLSIETIAELSGFHSTMNFRKAFKKRYETSPNIWRKNFKII